MAAKTWTHLALALVPLALTAPLHGQTGTLTGRVGAAETGTPLANVVVEVLETGEAPSETTDSTDASGQFLFTLKQGSYSILVRSIGYKPVRIDGVTIRAGAVVDRSVELSSYEIVLSPIQVVASRRQEKALDAPAHVSVVSSERIEERVSATVVDHVKTLPGIDAVQAGLTQANVVTRGFDNIFSGALLVLTDNRYVHLPSLRLNAYHMIPITDLDVDRIELSLGPGAALYGPNTANGVMHILTKSPIDKPGTEVSVAGGERSVFHGTFRHASSINDRWGFKISGQYFRGNDWEEIDSAEVLASLADPSNPRLGNRNFKTRRWSGEARVDHRFVDGSELILSAGMNRLSGTVELTPIGAARRRSLGPDSAAPQPDHCRRHALRKGHMKDLVQTCTSQTGRQHSKPGGQRHS